MGGEMKEPIMYPVVDTQEWAERYNISTEPSPCENCEKILHPTKPFATGRWRGLASEPHGCDEGYNMFVATKATPAERQEYRDFFQTLKSNLMGDSNE